jgi:hypothetical protein
MLLWVSAWVLVLANHLLQPYVYPYLPDSASYIEMARRLAHGLPPWVTPWDPSTEPDAIAQGLFPPGYPLLITLLMPLTQQASVAALWVVRLAACLLPVSFVWLWDGWLSRRALVVLSLLLLCSSGLVKMQYLAYSDVPTLYLCVLAIGLIVRALKRDQVSEQIALNAVPPVSGQPPLQLGSFMLAGFLAGCAYACRNAAIALLLTLLIWHLERWWALPAQRRLWRWRLLGLLLGMAVPVLLLWAYNWVSFHALQPYAMPASERGWLLNLLDLAAALSTDMGVPAMLVPGFWALLIPSLWWFLVLQGYRRVRHEPAGAVILLGALYVAITELVLWVSRTRYEWGGTLEIRHTLSITWAHGWILALLLYRGAQAIRRRQLATVAALSLVGLVANFAGVVNDWSHWGSEPYVRLQQDPSYVTALGPVPPQAMVVSNIAPFFRVELGLPVRELELGGSEADALQSFVELDRLVAHRPVILWLACSPYTSQYAICSEHPERSRLACTPVRTQYPKLFRCLTTPTDATPTRVASPASSSHSANSTSATSSPNQSVISRSPQSALGTALGLVPVLPAAVA